MHGVYKNNQIKQKSKFKIAVVHDNVKLIPGLEWISFNSVNLLKLRN